MDWYTGAKFLHIVFAIMWLGGGLCVTVLAMRAERANDDAELMRVIQSVVYLSPRLIVPASALTLVFGLVMVWLGQSFTDLWIIIGLTGFALTFAIGTGLIKPTTDRIAEIVAREGASPAAVAQAKRLLRVVKFDMVLLYTIVADMVLKPTTGDVGILTAMAVIVAAAAAMFLGPNRRPAVAGA